MSLKSIFPKGTICVERMFQGRMAIFPLHDQSAYKEWAGCFSTL